MTPNWSPKMMPTWLYRQDFAKFSLNRHYNVLNAQHRFDSRYLECVSEQMTEMKPFGDVPSKLILDIKRSFVATRTFVQALSVGEDVVKSIMEVGPTPECSRALMKMAYCPHCHGLPDLKPCSPYCLYVLNNCLNNHVAFGSEWSSFIGTGEYFPPLQFTCRNCGGEDRGRVAIYRPFGEVSLSLNRTVTCMVLKANDRRTSCPCHDEFRGPHSDYVRQFTCRNCGGGDRGRCLAIYRPFGEVSLSLNCTVTCMVLKANDRRTSCPCHDEFRGLRSDYVRQVALATTQQQQHFLVA
ncbi:glypican-6 [Trichonephila clavipes]|nr:glypican-6 [Trichonephila clavipes]